MRSTGLCYVQSSLTQYFLLANFIWMVAISINLLFLCFYPNKNLKKNEILYHVAAWGIPLIIVVLTKIPNISNDDGNQCRYRTANVIKFYVENIVIALFMIFNFIATIVTLKHIMYGSLRESETTTSSLLFNNEKKLVTKKIVWRLLLYPIILSICYILTLILDIYQFYEFNQGIRSDSELEMLLNFAKAILLFQGFFNGLVYLRSSKLRDTYKFAFQKLFCRHRYSSPDDDDSILPASEQTPYPSTFRR
ncbi:hypothetical protein CYY_003045 [Polysphondylium violaceum]|uniref:G-protein coupled receptors family 2 profile 2 domain-containing protein n=1 Tax=Polysphondylium violaceum TaxID=133409 RepID=A0A8J4Q0C4_9MYCE|nr:hypothetical protein CYY_003045 [Polysphondylium violaceum]